MKTFKKTNFGPWSLFITILFLGLFLLIGHNVFAIQGFTKSQIQNASFSYRDINTIEATIGGKTVEFKLNGNIEKDNGGNVVDSTANNTNPGGGYQYLAASDISVPATSLIFCNNYQQQNAIQAGADNNPYYWPQIDVTISGDLSKTSSFPAKFFWLNAGSANAKAGTSNDPACASVTPNQKTIQLAAQALSGNAIAGGLCGQAGATQNGLTCGSCSSQGCVWGTAATTASSGSPSCESNFDSGFEWVLCPGFQLADSAAGSFNSFIEDQLCFKTTTDSSSSTGSSIVCKDNNNLDNGVKNAWNIFKNIASALLVIAMLIMVISQALGGALFDAYTIRKMLPKLVAAVIIMQLSWVLLKWAIDLSNDVGSAIGNLLLAPFGGEKNLTLETLMGKAFSVHTTGTDNTFAFFTILAAGTAAFIVSIPTLALLALYVVLALLTAFLVLVFRKLLIILLVITAPIALVLWVMPGTDKYWKLWKDNFTKLLLMFPMIMGLLAAGKIFASITAGNSGVMFNPHLAVAHLGPLPIPYIASVTSFAELIIIIAAYFGPYFLLPQTYKWGGTALGAIAKGVEKGVERGSKPAKEYLNWRQGLSPWRQARAARKAEIERQSKLGFYEGLGDTGTKGRIRRARLAGVETPGHYRGVRDAINRRGRQQVEAEELKAATESLQLEISQARNHDQLVRDVALGNAGATWIDTSGNAHAIGERSEWEMAAAIGELARLGGAGNMRTIQEAHAAAQADTTDRGGRRREMMKKALDANADKLLGPLKHLYYGQEIVAGMGERINVHSTIEGLKPAGIAAMDGVEMETLLGELDTRIRTLPVGSAERGQAMTDLATLTSTYYQAITNESIRPNVGLGVSRAMKVYIDGSIPERVAEIRNPRVVGGTPIPGSPVVAGGTAAPGNPVIDVDPVTGVSRRMVDPATGTTTTLGTELVGVDPSLITALAHIHTHVDTSGNASA